MIADTALRASGVTGAPRLELTGVCKAFGGVPAVIDMSLAVSPGEIHAGGEIRLDGAPEAHPDLVGIGGTDGDSGKGAAIAVRDAGRTGKVKIVAMDRNDDMTARSTARSYKKATPRRLSLRISSIGSTPTR
jgi:hypothetical protein